MAFLNGQAVNVAAWARFGIQIVVVLLSVSGVYYKMDNRLSNVERMTLDNRTLITTMDSNGTHRSHEIDYGQQTQIDDIGRRLANIEVVLRDFIPKVERIDTNVLILMTQYGKEPRPR